MDLGFAVTTPMRPAETNTRAGFAMPAGATDTHFHVFEEGYPHVPDPQYTFPDGTLDQYLAMTRVLGIDRMVIVQPTYYGEDNSLTVDVLRKLGGQARGVVRVDETVSDAELDAYHEVGVRAIRLDLFGRRDWPAYQLEAYVDAMSGKASARGWHVQFYSPGPVVRDLLPYLARSDGRFVVDHMGYMKRSDGLGAADFERLVAALDRGNLWVKLTGPYRVAGSEPLESTVPLGRALVDARPDRLLWGTDWPHLPDGQRDTGELLNLLAAFAPDARARDTILVDSPAELFFAD
jgi:2-pyrone-4,6-dicarboxylate lactonase